MRKFILITLLAITAITSVVGTSYARHSGAGPNTGDYYPGASRPTR